jgi:hypothetical protein
LINWMRLRTTSSRCSINARNATIAWSTAALRSPDAVSAATPTEIASAVSFLWPCPVDSIRTRAASLAGTSTASIPSPASRVTNGPPGPLAPPIAHTTCDQRAANRRSCR